MRTSPRQFVVLVEFMERNGDLSKPGDGPHGRLFNITKWEELCTILNKDTSGTRKPIEKWKKVWSDLKNNTKRKAAKIHRATSGTGGGPASKLVLSYLEQRVLKLTGSQSTTDLQSVSEVGRELPQPHAVQEPRLSSGSPTPSYLDMQVEDAMEGKTRPGKSGESTPFPAIVLDFTVNAPTPHHTQSSPQSQHGFRRRHFPSLPQPRRRTLRHPAQRQCIDVVGEQFLASDNEWRNLAREFITENVRLRERELQQHTQWQILFGRTLNILERFVDKSKE